MLGACLGVAACSTPDLTADGERVVVTQNPPTADCVRLKYLVGRGGGTFGGDFITNESLIEYAITDLRNQAGDIGANYVQNDPPTLGNGDGTTTTATVSGVAYVCK